MGAYYTKEDITEYIGRNCILPYLLDKVSHSTQEMSTLFAPQGAVWQMLQTGGERYLFAAARHGYTPDWREQIPTEVAQGLDTTQLHLLERRAEWNSPTPATWGLPTEIWRETIERLQHCDETLAKIQSGAIHDANDFITYNLDIRTFVQDLLEQTESHRLIAHCYKALREITILDPTCGSGAFLFAAMNILEPLYETCISRMESFHSEHEQLFVDELGEIESRYRSNIQYFIYKSIILRNLYGVDIMAEAVEIAKLRLFLKMVAVVEVDQRADNLGLDPLPDIDFNIRCGNTLVGYTTKHEIHISYARNLFSYNEYEQLAETEMQKVSMAYRRFRDIQLTQQEDMESFVTAKVELRERLAAFNDLLHRQLFTETMNVAKTDHDRWLAEYDRWLADYQPFHWIAEYYEIIAEHGGFDVIIGNPPYVVYSAKSATYSIGSQYQTKSCSNLYAYCIERSSSLLSQKGHFGMIVPNSSISADKMIPLQEIITRERLTWISNFSWRPSKLFEGADMLLAIIIYKQSEVQETFSSAYNKWYKDFRSSLFSTLSYARVTDTQVKGPIPKMPSDLAFEILDKMRVKSNGRIFALDFCTSSSHCLYYFRAVQYWFKVLSDVPLFKEDGVDKVTGEMKPLYFAKEEDCMVAIALLSSTLFFLHYIIWSSCQVVNSRDFNLYFSLASLDKEKKQRLAQLGKTLQQDYQDHSQVLTRSYSKKGRFFTMDKQHFFIKYSKPIIDEIDKVLAEHYGFTEEELDFIINYDIKYRMGDELQADKDE